MIAAKEMAQLRVRLADLPGFDPEGLRVEYESERILCVGLFDGAVLLDDEGPDGERLAALPEQCEVSTADARTRDALARWLAERVHTVQGQPFRVGSTAPAWAPVTAVGGFTVSDGWSLIAASTAYFDRGVYAPDLDSGDDRLLPDGSRWVDAAALAAVARHVGGAR